MVHHAPITPTQNTPTVTDKQSARVQVRPWREALVVTFGLLFLIYATFIVAGLWYTGWERMLPPQANSVILTTGAAVTLGALQLALHHRRGRRSDEHFVVLSGQIAELREEVTSRRDWLADEPPTVPSLGGQRVYASVAAVTSRGINVEALLDSLVRRVDERFDDRVSDLRTLVETGHDVAGAGYGRDGSVRPLLPHGRR